MHDAALLAAVCARDLEERVERVAQMEDRRKVVLPRVRELCLEYALLHVARAVIVVEVQPHLADRERWPGRARDEGVESIRDVARCVFGFVGVNADRVVDAAGERRVASAHAVFEMRADRHHAIDAGGARAREHGVAVGVEGGIVDVRVGIEHAA